MSSKQDSMSLSEQIIETEVKPFKNKNMSEMSLGLSSDGGHYQSDFSSRSGSFKIKKSKF